jgi:hypothetical protein
VLSGLQLWRLGEAGPDGLGVHCGQDGLFLAGTPLIERQGAQCRVRPPGEVERLLSCAYGAAFENGPIVHGLARVAAALAADNLGLAQIAAVQLRLPALSGPLARVALRAEDLRLACERLEAALTRAGWDPAKHPRAGVPPNPGWFAPTGGAAEVVAQNEEEPRPEEAADPLAAVRRQMWHSDLATLREIDPANPQLFVLTAPGWTPRLEDLDRLDAAIQAAAIRRVLDKVRPGGVRIGTAGKSPQVRELPGGLEAARTLFDYLRVGGEVVEKPSLRGTLIRFPGNAGYVTFRPVSKSGPPAVEINLPGIIAMKIHFP